MSVDVSPSPAPEADSLSSVAPVNTEPAARPSRGRWQLLSPLIAGGLVLALSELAPNVDPTAESLLYPRLLSGLLVIALGFAAIGLGSWRFSAKLRRQAPIAAAGFLLLGAWDILTQKTSLLTLPYFPGPELVLGGMLDDKWLLLDCAAQSLKLLIGGYALGVFAGFTTGVLMGWFHRARYWGMPVLKLIGPLPPVALVPLAMELFHTSFTAGAALVALAVWFPVTMLTMSGIANVPASYFDVARTLGAKRPYLIFRVAIPAAMPTVFVGLFMGLGAAFLSLLVAESVGVSSGLAWYLKWKQEFFEYARVYAALIILAVLFSSIMTLLFKLRDWLLKWQKGVIRW